MPTPEIQAALLDPEIKKLLELYTAAGVQTNLETLQGTVVVDLTALRNAIVALDAKLDVLTAKLNADLGVTDTDYATNFAATIDPAALTTPAP
jgi:hypothetical protein